MPRMQSRLLAAVSLPRGAAGKTEVCLERDDSDASEQSQQRLAQAAELLLRVLSGHDRGPVSDRDRGCCRTQAARPAPPARIRARARRQVSGALFMSDPLVATSATAALSLCSTWATALLAARSASLGVPRWSFVATRMRASVRVQADRVCAACQVRSKGIQPATTPRTGLSAMLIRRVSRSSSAESSIGCGVLVCPDVRGQYGRLPDGRRCRRIVTRWRA